MKKILILVVMVVAFALPTMTQNYEAQQPTATFQSTSTFTGSGSTYSSNPTINENGTASTPSYAPGRPGNVRTTGTPPTPENDPNDPGNVPVGDAVLPLLLMAAAFAGVTYIRKRKTAHSDAHVK